VIAIRRSPRVQGTLRTLVMHKAFAQAIQWAIMPYERGAAQLGSPSLRCIRRAAGVALA
jgi:hypothetical protein